MIENEHLDCVKIFQSKKIIQSGKIEKTYTVTVRYIRQTEAEAKIKRSIVQNLMKKGYMKKGV